MDGKLHICGVCGSSMDLKPACGGWYWECAYCLPKISTTVSNGTIEAPIGGIINWTDAKKTELKVALQKMEEIERIEGRLPELKTGKGVKF